MLICAICHARSYGYYLLLITYHLLLITYYLSPITYYLLPITYSNSSFSGNQHELSLTVFLTRCSGGTDGSWDSSQGR